MLIRGPNCWESSSISRNSSSETGCAFVVVREGTACEAAEVVAWCESRLARYKRPSHVRFVEALPRTASGKVRKDRLRQAFADSAP